MHPFHGLPPLTAYLPRGSLVGPGGFVVDQRPVAWPSPALVPTPTAATAPGVRMSIVDVGSPHTDSMSAEMPPPQHRHGAPPQPQPSPQQQRPASVAAVAGAGAAAAAAAAAGGSADRQVLQQQLEDALAAKLDEIVRLSPETRQPSYALATVPVGHEMPGASMRLVIELVPTPVSHTGSLDVVAPNVQGEQQGDSGRVARKSITNAEFTTFDLADLEMGKILGTGSYGCVRLARFRSYPAPKFAVKVLTKQHIINSGQLEHVASEIRIQQAVNHPFVVKLHASCQDERHVYLLFDFYSGGDLFFHLRRRRKFAEPDARFYAAQVVLMFEYLHTYKTVYRDLKPENLLVAANGYLVLADFGFAKRLAGIERTFTLCGTPEYLAPEIVQNLGHDTAVDWWTLGVLLFEMLCGHAPFFSHAGDNDPMNMYQRIIAGKYAIPPALSPEVSDLIQNLLVADRTRRLGNLRGGSDDIKQHPWFTGFSWDALIKGELTAPLAHDVAEQQAREQLSFFDPVSEEEASFDSSVVSPDTEALFARITG